VTLLTTDKQGVSAGVLSALCVQCDTFGSAATTLYAHIGGMQSSQVCNVRQIWCRENATQSSDREALKRNELCLSTGDSPCSLYQAAVDLCTQLTTLYDKQAGMARQNRYNIKRLAMVQHVLLARLIPPIIYCKTAGTSVFANE
jgi:hypothetical protein